MAFTELRPMPGDSENDLLRKLIRSIAVSIGGSGHDVLYAPGQHVGEWLVLHAISAAQVIIRRDGEAEILTLVAGDRIFGRITTAEALSGVVELYRD